MRSSVPDSHVKKASGAKLEIRHLDVAAEIKKKKLWLRKQMGINLENECKKNYKLNWICWKSMRKRYYRNND